MRTCGNCGAIPVFRHERCAACFWWRRRHNRMERPEEAIVRHGRRLLERHLEGSYR